MKTIDIDISFYPNYTINDPNTKKYDIEIGFTRSGCENFSINEREHKRKGHVSIDFERLQELYNKEAYQDYGNQLREYLFTNPDILEIFNYARTLTTADVNSIPLRIRLFILPKLIELHNLHWETIMDPDSVDGDPKFLLKNNNVYFFRYFTSAEWKPVPLLPQENKLSTLVFVSNPEIIDESYDFEPIVVEKVMEPIEYALGDINKDRYPSGPNDNATLDALINKLQNGVNILYLICPAITEDGKTYLFFENSDGRPVKIRGKTLITRLKELTKKPFLIIISACHNHKGNKPCNISQTLCGLAQRLISSGFPIVLSIQGKMSDDSTATFLSTFFKQLKQYDQIDKAVAAARYKISNQYDFLMPVLYMRIKSGRIWYKKGFTTNPEQSWKDLVTYIGQDKKCVPILGPGLSENILGSYREIAQDWADTYNFPLTPYQQDQLHLVAHYMSVVHPDPNLIKSVDFLNYIFKKLKTRFQDKLNDPQRLIYLEQEFNRNPGQAINDFICNDIPTDMETNPKNPHRVLANLPSQIYITTKLTDLLKDAIFKTGRGEASVIPNIWNQKKENRDDAHEIKKETPLIYHLFGHITKPYDLVLSEDELFDLMIKSAKDINNIDANLAGAVMNNCILLLEVSSIRLDFQNIGSHAPEAR